jgi:TolB protein
VSRTAVSAATGNGASEAPSISAEGRLVAFQSDATNLVAGLVDDNEAVDVFVLDRDTGITTLVSRRAGSASTTADDFSFGPLISADGGWVAFASGASDLIPDLVVAPPVPGTPVQVYLADWASGGITLVSRGVARTAGRPGRSTPANGGTELVVVNADGSVVLVDSEASNLVAGDRNGRGDAYVWARPCPDRSSPRPCPGPASRPVR